MYWEDIDTGRLFWARHDTLEHRCFYTGDVVGGFTLQADGSLLLFEADRISVLDPESGARRVLRSGIDPDMKRFNDVIADPEGRVFAGTIGQSVNSGGLYRVDRDGSIRCLFKDTGCANGMGFSTDLSRLYWTCSTKRCIYAFDYDRGSGELDNRRVLYQAHPSEGLPDGLAVDERDDLLSARWDGSSVLLDLTGRTDAGAHRVPGEARVVGRVRWPGARHAVRHDGRRRLGRAGRRRHALPYAGWRSRAPRVPIADRNLSARARRENSYSAGVGFAGSSGGDERGSGLPSHHALSRAMLNGRE